MDAPGFVRWVEGSCIIADLLSVWVFERYWGFRWLSLIVKVVPVGHRLYKGGFSVGLLLVVATGYNGWSVCLHADFSIVLDDTSFFT